MANCPPRRRNERFLDPEDAFQIISEGDFRRTLYCEKAKTLLSKDFSTILGILKQELGKNDTYKKAWDKAEKEFKKKEAKLKKKNSGMKPLGNEYHIAVIAYTLEKPNLYEDFNRKCRALSSTKSWDNFPYKSLYYLLGHSIQGIRSNPNNNVQQYYRGISHKINNLKKGNYIFPRQFLSCSVNKDEASYFMHGDGTLIKFIGSPAAACGIRKYSRFPNEEEILVFPWSTFRVDEIPDEAKSEIVVKSDSSRFQGFPY